MTSQDLRKVFLRQFTQEIVWHARQRILIRTINSEKEKQNTLSSAMLSETNDTTTTASEMPEKETLQKNASAVRRYNAGANKLTLQPRSHSLLPPSDKRAMPLPYKIPTILLQRRTPQPKVYLAPATESWLVNLQSLSRIQPLLADPTITTIECPGPGLPIMISRGTYVQSTPSHFTTEEIKKIIEEISESTKIPLGASGIFKAAIGNIIITAILSEFVGTRFVIQKKPRAPSSRMPSAPLRR